MLDLAKTKGCKCNEEISIEECVKCICELGSRLIADADMLTVPQTTRPAVGGVPRVLPTGVPGYMGTSQVLQVDSMKGGFYGPRIVYWKQFVGQVLDRIGASDIEFCSSPFPVLSTRQDALQMDFKSSVRFEITSTSPWWDSIGGVFGDIEDAESLVIEVRPAKRKEMRKSFDSIIQNLPSEGTRKIIAKGRAALEDSLTDFYIAGSGFISDIIEGKDENQICQEIEDKKSGNSALQSRLTEFAHDPNFSAAPLSNLVLFNDRNSWDRFLSTAP